MAQIQPPETFDFSTPNEWPKWRKRFERYLVVSGMKKKEEADKIDLFMYLMGDRADDIFRTFKFEKEEEATKIDSVLKAFDSHFCVRKNIIYERAKFNSRIQEDREPVDEFITSLYKLADSCEFEGLHEQLIRDRIVVGVRDKALSERMQLDSELTLEKAVKMVRQQEAVRQQQVDLQRPSTSQKVNQVKFNSKKQSPKQQQQPSRKKEKSAITRSRCPKCGGFTHREGQACSAEGQKCNLCSKTGHFANCCPDKQAKTAEVKAVSELDEEIGVLLEVSAVEDASNLDDDEGECRRRWTAEIQVNGKKVKFKLDSQADVTCVPLCLFKKIMGQQRLVKSDINLRAAEFPNFRLWAERTCTARSASHASGGAHVGQLGEARFFSKLDANSGFHQIPLSPDCQHLTTFITPFGRYKYCRMPFGISLAPEYFQRVMSIILQGMDGVMCYLDDILIFASDSKTHDRILRLVLRKLKEAKVTLNKAKCVFGVPRINFLGHILDEDGIRPDPAKIEAVAKMPAPTDVHGVRRFLGMVNHLGRFVENLSEIVAPLNQLLVKGQDFVWDCSQERAFRKLKELLTTQPILAAYDVRKPTMVSSDASSYGLGAVLKQEGKNGIWRPVAYSSRTMTPTEKRYAQTLKRKEGRRRKDMKSRYDRRCGATDMEELSEGDTVWITDMRTWGIVKKKASTPRSYMVDTPVGTLRRNRFHLRKGVTVQYPADPSTPTFSGEELVENEKTPVVDYPSNDSEDGQIRTRSGRIVKPGDVLRTCTRTSTYVFPRDAAERDLASTETFDFSTPNEWPKWRKRFERYLVVSGMKKKEEADKIDLFMYLMGDRADDIFRTFKFEKEEEATKIDSVLKAFDSHFCVRKNIIYERAKFNSRIQEDREPVDEFITSLYKLADSCEFEGLHEQLIRDRIVVGVRDEALSERMQLDSELTLEKAVKMIRQQEAVRQQQVDLQRPSTSQKVNQVKFNSKKQSPKQQQQPSRKKEKSAKIRSRCPKCGGFTHREGQACRAEGQKCNLCSKTGHFANCCPDKQAKTAEVKAVSELDEEIGVLLEVSAVEDSSNLDDDEGECRRRWTAEIQVNGKQVKFKLDSQADVTCVPLCLFKKIMGQQRLVKSDINIRAAEFSELQTVGMFISTLRNGNYEIKEKIYVIRRLSEPLLSRRACELLNLARRIEVVATRINPIKEFPEVFEGLGQIGYSYEIKLKPGAKPYAVHTPRQVPIPLMEKLKTRLEELDKDDILTKIFEAQQEDTTLKAVVNYLEQGWPDKKKMSQALLSYWHVKDELGVQNGLLMRSCRFVIPASMKLEILDKLHAGHFGITKTRLRARETVWWPGISEEITETVRKCSVCIQEAVSKHEPLIPTNFPTRPWQKIGMDLFKFENKWYLVVIDYYSRFPEMIQLDRLAANVVVRSCKSIFARHGIPETVVSDNGTQFGAARDFANFARQYGFTHVTSSPRFPQSNGMAEAGVKIAKLILKKNQDPSLGLLEYRSTPLENGYSPAELLMGRKLRTTLPIAPGNLNPKLVDSQTLKRKEGRRRKDMKSRYDRRCGATDMEELSEGDTVWITDMRTWGIVKQKASTPRSYMVDTPVGTLRRNRFHLRKGVTVQYPADPSTPTFSGEELVENGKTPVVDYPSNDSEDGQIRTR
ncbi:K02A2.6-like, partial [Cordylochernes scorpioides]